MIPHKLQLKNFLSYGPQLQTIDFAGHSLICLSGKNGHGKSALLDAMTWAVWGQARKVIGAAKADQGLLRLGQTHMLVMFDFEFNGTLYRIRREYMETFNKPVAVLEFGTINAKTQEFIPLTDKTIRTTQAKIEHILRLDFEAFSNTAFLRQGNSNEFSKKAPKDRKSILASILGLDQYEAIRKQALEKIKDATHKKTALAMLQEKRVAELAAQEHLTQEHAALEYNMIAIQQEEQEWQTGHTQLKKTHADLEKNQKQASLLFLQKQQYEATLAEHITQLAAMRSQWRNVNAKKQTLQNVHQLEQNKKEMLLDIAQYQAYFQQSLECKEELLRVTQELNALEQQHKNNLALKTQTILIAIERLSAERTNKHNIIALLDDEYKKNEREYQMLAQTINTLTSNIAEQTKTDSHIQQTEAALEKRKNTYHSFVSLGNAINAELKHISQKKNLLDVENPSCPLCEQNLSASRRRLLSSHFIKQESFLLHRLERLKRIIPPLKTKLVEHHEQLQKDKEQVQLTLQQQNKQKELCYAQDKIALTNIELTAKIAALQQEIVHFDSIIQQHQREVVALEKDNTLTKNAEYQTLMHKKETIEKKFLSYTYTSETYESKQKALKALEEQLTEYESLQQDIAHQNNRKEAIRTLCATIKQCKHAIAGITHELENFKDLDAKISTLATQEKEHNDQWNLIRNKKEQLLLLSGSLTTKQKHLETIKAEYEQEKAVIAQQDAIIQDYQIICTATGKDGIQALLIEEAIPEIEQEANQLLSQLTNNQAHIFIESLRDLKKGGTKETLDIKISDQNGIRPYELFSGGEAFRIDFALRIAISKLLARRAGTALQTLIIDEGFGSQDDEGLSYIMDALHAIQNNFSKIIVVSHLPTMKDQFPVQFVVHKGIQGSVVTVVEQG